MSPLLSAALRFTVAALVLVGLRATRYQSNEISLTRRNKYALFVIATIGVTIQNFSIFFAMKYTQAVNASVVMANMPLAGILLSALLLKTPISRFNIAGALVSIVGVLLVITGGNILSLSFNSGDLLMVVALTSGCLYTILSKRWTPNIPIGQQLRWMMCLGALQMLIIAAVKGTFSMASLC
ncbi:DMT family transporter [Shewanella psychropiezotolerans]|uniref:DMT family transporter n=1 Tax=Shewanella psychropiezotolerans TaxID=2593655 RepID=UPI001C8F3668